MILLGVQLETSLLPPILALVLALVLALALILLRFRWVDWSRTQPYNRDPRSRFGRGFTTLYQVREQQSLHASFIKLTTHEMKERVCVELKVGRVHLDVSKVRFDCAGGFAAAFRSVSSFMTRFGRFCGLLGLLPAIKVIQDAIARMQGIVNSITINLYRSIKRGTRLLKVGLLVFTRGKKIGSEHFPSSRTSSIWLIRSKFHVFFWFIFYLWKKARTSTFSLESLITASYIAAIFAERSLLLNMDQNQYISVLDWSPLSCRAASRLCLWILL